MEAIDKFLAHAVQLECESARRYEELAESMRTAGNREVESFFRKMATFSRKHMADAIARSGFRKLPVMERNQFIWPDGISPEQFGWAGVDALMEVTLALGLALESERRGHSFYASFAQDTDDPAVRVLASEFAEEEAEHVSELEKWVARYSLPEKLQQDRARI